MAAMTAPERISAQHQSLLHFVKPSDFALGLPSSAWHMVTGVKARRKRSHRDVRACAFASPMATTTGRKNGC
jgi:hypothetical protein